MAVNYFYIAAGLQGDRDDPPATGTNVFYITAGLPPEVVEEAPAAGGPGSYVLGGGICA